MKKTPEQIVLEIQSACEELGWHIGMDESAPGLKGLVIGQSTYVESIVEQIEDCDSYAIYTSAGKTDGQLH